MIFETHHSPLTKCCSLQTLKTWALSQRIWVVTTLFICITMERNYSRASEHCCYKLGYKCIMINVYIVEHFVCSYLLFVNSELRRKLWLSWLWLCGSWLISWLKLQKFRSGENGFTQLFFGSAGLALSQAELSSGNTNGSVDHQISIPINTMMQCVKIVIEAVEKENTRDQRKLKIATLTISIYTSILMCLISKAGILQKICNILQRETTRHLYTLVKYLGHSVFESLPFKNTC